MSCHFNFVATLYVGSWQEAVGKEQLAVGSLQKTK
jgi:hypothetical protein